MYVVISLLYDKQMEKRMSSLAFCMINKWQNVCYQFLFVRLTNGKTYVIISLLYEKQMAKRMSSLAFCMINKWQNVCYHKPFV